MNTSKRQIKGSLLTLMALSAILATQTSLFAQPPHASGAALKQQSSANLERRALNRMLAEISIAEDFERLLREIEADSELGKAMLKAFAVPSSPRVPVICKAFPELCKILDRNRGIQVSLVARDLGLAQESNRKRIKIKEVILSGAYNLKDKILSGTLTIKF